MTEYQEFVVADIIVISLLWCYQITSDWLLGLSFYTSQVLFPDEELRSEYFRTHNIWIFFTKCITILLLAFFADAYDHKFVQVFTALCFSLCIPAIAVVICVTKNALAAVLLFWTVCSIEAVSPLTFCLIFNQNLHPVRRIVRRIVASLELIRVIFGKYMVFLCIPVAASGTVHEQYVLIVDWVIFTPILVTLITLVERARKLVSGDFTIEKGFGKLFRGIRHDMMVLSPERKGKSPLHMIFFILLLAPGITVSVLDATLNRMMSDDIVHARSFLLKHIMYATHISVIPCTEVILSFLPCIKDTAGEMLSLSIVHVINVAVVTMLLFRLEDVVEGSKIPSTDRAKRNIVEQLRFVCDVGCEIGPLKPGTASFMVINSIDRKILINNNPPVFFKKRRTGVLNSGLFLFGVVELPSGKSSLPISVTATILTATRPTLKKRIIMYEKKYHLYVISGNDSNIEWIEVTGTENVSPKEAPQLIFLNTLAEEEIDGIPVLSDNEYRINSPNYEFEERFPFPSVGQYDVVELPVGELQVSYAYLGTNEYIAKALGSYSVSITAKPFGIYLCFVVRKKKAYFYVVTAISPPNATITTMEPLPSFQEPDIFQKSAYALAGAALGIASVGYLHFFWLESPVRMRAVIFAFYKVSTSLASWVTERLVGDTFTRPIGIALLLLQVVTTVWHLCLCWIFQTKIRSTRDTA